MTQHYVDIISHENDATVKTLGPYGSDSLAERAERGLDRQIDHGRFYTQTREEES